MTAGRSICKDTSSMYELVQMNIVTNLVIICTAKLTEQKRHKKKDCKYVIIEKYNKLNERIETRVR